MNMLRMRILISKWMVGCALLSAVLSLAVLPARATFAASPTCGSWSIASSPNPSSQYNFLNGVAAISANDAWAVGYESANTTGSISLTLIEHWDGTSWTVVNSQNPTNQNTLNAVAGVSTNDVWAVGLSQDPNSGVYHTLIEHWNGTAWSIVASPNPSTIANDLTAVTVISTTNVWAVGNYNDTNSHSLPLIEHWNGKVWKVVSTPTAGSGATILSGVTAISAGNVWAVGTYQPDPSSLQTQTLTERWSGKSWTIVTSSNNGAINNLTGVTWVPGTKTLWAVGGYSGATSTPQSPLLEYWNGKSWKIVPSPSSGLNVLSLNSIAAISATNVWAVGSYHDANSGLNATLTEQWNGTSWSIVSSPNAPTGDSYFYTVTTVPASSNLWAVGVNAPGTGPADQTLTASYC